MKKIMYIRSIIFTAAIVLILLGISQKGYVDMMNKAIWICFECIGIG